MCTASLTISRPLVSILIDCLVHLVTTVTGVLTLGSNVVVHVILSVLPANISDCLDNVLVTVGVGTIQ